MNEISLNLPEDLSNALADLASQNRRCNKVAIF
ncbi:hypothetical protein C4J93_1646 [Pseudomonas sp. R2-37-08W]|nr:hypothetical protein C4J93_1646 [Pseudomonas sp. R2-37-08W]